MVYVDQVKQYGTKRWCHLYADTERELFRMAKRLRATPKISKSEHRPHLDLSDHQRKVALRYGAQKLDW